MTLEELRRKREEIVLEHFRAENAHDVEGVLSTFETPRYKMMHLGRDHNGPDEVAMLINGLINGLPDIHAEPGELRHLEDAVVVECQTTGTHLGFFAGLEPTGKKINARSACIFEFEEDRLQCEKVYLDFATILRQLGVLPPLPGPVAQPSGAD